MTMMKTAALYLRVSTNDGRQTVQNQRLDLEAAAARMGWQIVAEFSDEGISGAKGRDKRPGLDRLLKGVARREFDLVAAWSVDRLGRSLRDLLDTLAELHAKGVDLYLHRQALDTSTPAGKAMFGMLGVFADFERSLITERTRAGQARARAAGKVFGRPRVPEAIEAAVRASLKAGRGICATAKLVKCGVGTVARIKRENLNTA